MPSVLCGWCVGSHGGLEGSTSICFHPRKLFEIAGIVDTTESKERGGFDFKVDRVVFEKEQSSWEPLKIIWECSVRNDGAVKIGTQPFGTYEVAVEVRNRTLTF